MNTTRTILFALLVSAAATAQDRLAVSSGLSGSGTVCDPWSCTPTTVSAVRGYALSLTAAGSVAQPRALLLSFPPAICVPIAGIDGALQVSQPMALYLPMTWRRIYVNPGPGQSACGGWMGFGRLPWPTTIPVGFQVVVQTLSFTSGPNGVALLSFSNAVEVTAR